MKCVKSEKHHFENQISPFPSSFVPSVVSFLLSLLLCQSFELLTLALVGLKVKKFVFDVNVGGLDE